VLEHRHAATCEDYAVDTFRLQYPDIKFFFITAVISVAKDNIVAVFICCVFYGSCNFWEKGICNIWKDKAKVFVLLVTRPLATLLVGNSSAPLPAKLFVWSPH